MHCESPSSISNVGKHPSEIELPDGANFALTPRFGRGRFGSAAAAPAPPTFFLLSRHLSTWSNWYSYIRRDRGACSYANIESWNGPRWLRGEHPLVLRENFPQKWKIPLLWNSVQRRTDRFKHLPHLILLNFQHFQMAKENNIMQQQNFTSMYWTDIAISVQYMLVKFWRLGSFLPEEG